MATILLIGRLAAPATRTPAGGSEARIVVEKGFRGADGEERTARTEVAIRAAGAVAEALAAVAPEREVLVEGRLRLHTGHGACSGVARYVVEAERVEVQSA